VLHAPGELLDELARARGNRWTHTEELLALVLEAVDRLRIDMLMQWSDPKSRPARAPRPYRYPRPAHVRGSDDGQRKATREEIAAFFGKRR